jgi:hypothetical protein
MRNLVAIESCAHQPVRTSHRAGAGRAHVPHLLPNALELRLRHEARHLPSGSGHHGIPAGPHGPRGGGQTPCMPLQMGRRRRRRWVRACLVNREEAGAAAAPSSGGMVCVCVVCVLLAAARRCQSNPGLLLVAHWWTQAGALGCCCSGAEPGCHSKQQSFSSGSWSAGRGQGRGARGQGGAAGGAAGAAAAAAAGRRGSLRAPSGRCGEATCWRGEMLRQMRACCAVPPVTGQGLITAAPRMGPTHPYLRMARGFLPPQGQACDGASNWPGGITAGPRSAVHSSAGAPPAPPLLDERAAHRFGWSGRGC